MLGLGLATSAESQTIEFTAQKAQLAGVELRAVNARLQANPAPSMQAGPPSSTALTADISLQFFDHWVSKRTLDVQLQARLDARHWQIVLDPITLPIVAESESLQATLQLGAQIFGRETIAPEALRLQLQVIDLQYADDAGTIAAEGVRFDSDFTWQAAEYSQTLRQPRGPFTVQVRSEQGAMLAGPVFIDFAAHPLHAQVQGEIRSAAPWHLILTSAEVSQPELVSAKASMQTHIKWPALDDTQILTPQVDSAELKLSSLQFPGAYQSFLRTALAGTLLGNLRTTGHLSGTASIRHNALQTAHLVAHEISLADQRAQALHVDDLSGELHWQTEHEDPAHPLTEDQSTPRISSLGWTAASLNGIPAQATRLNFLWYGDILELTEPSRIPILDGALRIDTFRVRDWTTPHREIVFDGRLEPVSLPALTQALGWPSLAGTLTGRAPGVRYQDDRLTLSGALEAEVFGGRIAGRDLVIAQPFSRWPRLTVDITLDDLDLALLTSTFDIGAMSGRVGGEISNLELFGWQPVAFDASIATIETAPEPRRISVRAINSIANIGGTAGSGVGAALQGGLLRFFDSYRYRRLGLRCVLRDDVCWMSGTGPSAQRFGDRYTLLEGAGLPRLDIIGYTGRVKWSQLVEQITTQIQTGAGPVRAP